MSKLRLKGTDIKFSMCFLHWKLVVCSLRILKSVFISSSTSYSRRMASKVPFLFPVSRHNVSFGSILLNFYILKNMAGVLPYQFEPDDNPGKPSQEHNSDS